MAHPHLELHTDLGELYSDHHPWILKWLSKKLGDRHQAADLAHDTFMRLLTRQEAMVLQEPQAFLMTVAQRVLFNHWRRQALEQAYLQALASLPVEQVPSPETRAILFETLLEIDRILDGLAPQVRRAFLLSQLDGLSHGDIAQKLGISISTVKRHLFKAAMHCYFPELAGS